MEGVANILDHAPDPAETNIPNPNINKIVIMDTGTTSNNGTPANIDDKEQRKKMLADALDTDANFETNENTSTTTPRTRPGLSL